MQKGTNYEYYSNTMKTELNSFVAPLGLLPLWFYSMEMAKRYKTSSFLSMPCILTKQFVRLFVIKAEF
jgi:hypothetical protein